MASEMSSEGLKSLCECPVCLEPFRKPRLLTCGHQYCECCLKDIVRHSPQNHIPCPSCRVVTKPQHGDVTTLPRSTLHQYMQELIFRQPTTEALGQKCTKCKVNKPTCHCQECTSELSYLCGKCFAVHQKVERFAKHTTVPFNPSLVCSDHPHRMVENFCYSCKVVACVDCLFDKHSEHNTEYLGKAAEESRKRLRQYIFEQRRKVIDKYILKKLKNASDVLEKNKAIVRTNTEKLKKAIQLLEKKVDDWLVETIGTIENGAKTLSTQQTKISEVMRAQEKMLKLAESLLGDVSDPQVIMGSLDMPCPDLDITHTEVNMPVAVNKIGQLIANIEKIGESVTTSFKKEIYDIPRGTTVSRAYHNTTWSTKHVRDLPIVDKIQGLIYNSRDETLVMRDADSNGQVKVYDKSGRKVRQLGKGVLTVPGTMGVVLNICCIALDPQRDLYLLPCNDGTLVRMEMDGKIRDTTKLGTNLCGVAYLPEEDLYVLSDLNDDYTGSVLTVSPGSNDVLRYIGDKGSYYFPCHVCTGYTANSPIIVVSDCGKDLIHLYTTSAKLMRTYNPKDCPQVRKSGWDPILVGVAVDSAGRVIICLYRSHQVFRVWTDEAGDHWECVLDTKQLGGRPYSLALDDSNRQMAVSVGDKSVRVFIY